MNASRPLTAFLTPANLRSRFAEAYRLAERAICSTPMELVLRERKSSRTVEQNNRLHAMCADVAAQREWAGKRLDTEGWKRLFVDAWARETGGGGGQVVPSLDGQSVVVLNRSTRAMSVAELSELMEWIAAWCAENGVALNDREAA